jgi:hypothetical protein
MNIFKSQLTNDVIHLGVFLKSHRALFKLKFVESASEHIKLISDIESFLRKNDIKWIEFNVTGDLIAPVNSVCYKNKYNNNTVCHIEDFTRFYYANIKNLFKVTNIKCKNKNIMTDSKGWITVQSPHKYKQDAYAIVIKELELFGQTLLNDWSI